MYINVYTYSVNANPSTALNSTRWAEHRHPELLYELGRRHGVLRSGPLLLPSGL